MRIKKKAQKPSPSRGAPKSRLHPEAKGFLFLATGFLSLLALMTFRVDSPSADYLGYLGYGTGFCASYAFGLGSWLLPCYLFWWGSQLLQTKGNYSPMNHLYFLVLLISSSFLLNVFAESYPQRALDFQQKVLTQVLVLDSPYRHTVLRTNLGGIPLYYIFRDLPFFNLQHILSTIGTTLIFSSLSLVSFLLLTRVRIFSHLRVLSRALLELPKSLPSAAPLPQRRPAPAIYTGLAAPIPKEKPQILPIKTKVISTPESLPSEKRAEKPKPEPKTVAEPAVHLPVKYDNSYKLPPLNLLKNPQPKIDQPTLTKDLHRQGTVLEETLKSFGIEAKVGEIHSGPTITSFEVHPSIGVKVQKIKALENDIALNMQARSLRIVAPIPGKAAVGVEVPALHPQEVSFREMLQHYQQQKNRKLQIPILLGKGVSGEPVFSDLARMPHLLIAGATGSGKSVCINTIVMSMLMNARPEELRLLMVDPKKVELTQYSKLPHMIAPVITEPHGAYAALQWLVREMQQRYEILKQLGLRNITAFNNRKLNPELESSLNIPIPAQLPYIVAIVDEFADLMMVSSADIETPIARIAQMARAVGIHLILATQRPSREVITGIIKANIPCRIAFKVASRINSQIILDDVGAESLLGNGDCLFLPPGSSQLLRAQGAYISDDEINRVIQHVCLQSEPNYLIPSFDAFRALPGDGNDLDEVKGKDALYDQALTLVLHTKMASTTYLQRKLKIGYARAASLIDELEENGIVGPSEGSKPRRILSGSGTQTAFEEDDSIE